MSSSESDEFYDALDVSPTKATEPERHTKGAVSLETNESGSLSMSNEEEEILEARKFVTIQRRLEDEALARRLKAIQERRIQEQEELSAKQALEESAIYNDRRRKKLEEMRMMIKDEGANTPAEPHSVLPTGRNSSEFSFKEVTNEAHIGERAGHNQDGEEIQDNLVNIEIEQSLPAHFVKMENPPNSSSQENRKNPSTISNQRNESNLGFSGSSSRNSSSHVVFGGQSIPMAQDETETKFPPKGRLSAVEPDLIQSVKSSSLGRNSSVPDMRITQPTADSIGPDIKSDVSVRRDHQHQDSMDMPPPPVVPPRRKKKAVSMGSLYQEQVSSSLGSRKSGPDVPSRSGSVPPQTLAVPASSSQEKAGFLLTAPSPQVGRKALDFKDATMGDRLVTASENEYTRAVNDVQDSQSEKDWQRTVSITESNTSSSTVYSTGPSPPTLEESEVQGAGATAKSNSFPRVQLRASVSPEEQGTKASPAYVNPLTLLLLDRVQDIMEANTIPEGGDGKKTENEEHQTINTVKGLGRKKKKLKSLFGKAKSKLKSVKDEVFNQPETSSSSEDEDGERRMIKVKAAKSHKGPYDFDLLVPVQYVETAHHGAVWTMKFSPCGRLIATGGQDNLLKVWVLKDAYTYFDDMRLKYSEEQKKKLSPAVSEDSVDKVSESSSSRLQEEDEPFAPFNREPFCTYKGHTADILDVSWSKNYFILTSSMDKTVRLWHVSRKECLCCFQHIDFVTAIAFHPKDDRYFLSGSLDGKLRLWNIPDKKVTLWNEVSGSTKLITAANFCMNGKFAVVGTYDGRCVFYSTEQLKYYTQIHVRSTRGKNSRGRKVTGVEPYPGEDKILVTSNDSRIRLYDLRDLTLTCKYKGCLNNSSQIKASFSHNGRFILCGSEDHFVYIWRTQHEFHKFSSARRDRSDYWESIKAHNAVVTVAVFAPQPGLIIKNQFEYLDSADKLSTPDVRGEVLISADYNGTIKFFINKFKPGSG